MTQHACTSRMGGSYVWWMDVRDGCVGLGSVVSVLESGWVVWAVVWQGRCTLTSCRAYRHIMYPMIQRQQSSCAGAASNVRTEPASSPTSEASVAPGVQVGQGRKEPVVRVDNVPVVQTPPAKPHQEVVSQQKGSPPGRTAVLQQEERVAVEATGNGSGQGSEDVAPQTPSRRRTIRRRRQRARRRRY